MTNFLKGQLTEIKFPGRFRDDPRPTLLLHFSDGDTASLVRHACTDQRKESVSFLEFNPHFRPLVIQNIKSLKELCELLEKNGNYSDFVTYLKEYAEAKKHGSLVASIRSKVQGNELCSLTPDEQQHLLTLLGSDNKAPD